jgi:CheY-like chemotaxis protein
LLVVEDFEGSSTGKQAIEEARRARPDVIVMDLGLPRVNGWELIQRLKSEAATRHIPVLALTGHVQPRFADLVRAAGADTVLRKPRALDELLREIERLLRRDDDARHP